MNRGWVFLGIWLAGAGLGLWLLPGVYFLTVIVIALFNATVVSVFVFGIAGITRRGFGHKAFAILLILVLGGFLYQNPAILKNVNSASLTGLLSSEANYAGSLGAGFQNTRASNPGSNANTQSNPIQNLISNLGGGGGPTIDAAWVSSFISILNSHRSVPLTESSNLDTFASQRYSTIIAHYSVSHYGFADAFDSYFAGQAVSGSEEYFQPNMSPSDYISYLQSSAPVHWQGLIDSTYTHFGFHLGPGPTYEIYQPCPVSEIVGSVNETQLLQRDGCSFTVATVTYFVIELTS